MEELISKKCVPCEGGTVPMKQEDVLKYLGHVQGWKAEEDRSIVKEFRKKNFREAILFVQHIGELAENEGHHPDILLHNWNRVRITLSTHAISGLSENDFILAAKIDRLNDADSSKSTMALDK